MNIYYTLTILIGLVGLAYTIIHNSSLFVKRKIIFDIFDEISYLSELNNIELNEFMYLCIYVFGAFVLLYLRSIQNTNIIVDFFSILVLSMLITVSLTFFNVLIKKLKRKKSKQEKPKRKA